MTVVFGEQETMYGLSLEDVGFITDVLSSLTWFGSKECRLEILSWTPIQAHSESKTGTQVTIKVTVANVHLTAQVFIL